MEPYVPYSLWKRYVRLNLAARKHKSRVPGIARISRGEFVGRVGYYDPVQRMLWEGIPYMTDGIDVGLSQVTEPTDRQVLKYLELHCNQGAFDNLVRAAQKGRARSKKRNEYLGLN